MQEKIISGKAIAQQLIETDLIPRVQNLKTKGVTPKLVVVLVGDHAASASYVRQKEKFATKAGILSEVRRFDAETSEAEILAEIQSINADQTIHGVIVQLPLPKHVSIKKILETIDPAKDVDGFTPVSVGNLFLGAPCLKCCTPKGIIRMIEGAGVDLSGKNVAVIGRSNIVGKPVAMLALQKNATVTICHSRTKNLSAKIADSDVVIVAVGKPKLIKAVDLPKGCVVIDVGIHRVDGKLCGDVDFDDVIDHVAKISPVPGGVGPMTVVSLIENTIESAENKSV
jgi:methylenetetrahydrofolate dehydrogenase (NADP+)/methenyltetrahydrofolate cyclohydrolase